MYILLYSQSLLNILSIKGVCTDYVLYEKELIKQLAKNPNKKTAEYSQNTIKSLFGSLIQQMPEVEIEEYLGYSKYDYTNKNTTNSRNGKSKKTVKSDLDIPRDCDGSFEPQIIKKHQTDISRLEISIIGMYEKGMSTRDIATPVNEMYDMDVSYTLISNITDKIIPSIKRMAM